MKAYERFLKYISFDTQSDENSDTCPSTEGQLVLGDFLANELRELGAVNVEKDENGYVYGTVPASKGAEDKPVLALVAHMDTAMDMSGKDIKPQIIRNYDGSDIVLNKDLNIVTTTEQFPELLEHISEDIIVTDGTTLLGADDKAGISEIMTLCEYLINNEDVKHPELRVVFTPDEEIGRGVDKINMDKVNASYGYTVDGENLKELCYENFNAASAFVKLHGNCVHTGSAFGIMRNASLLAMEFQALLPVFDNPASTKDRMGFFHLNNMEGDVEEANLVYIIRDHDERKLEFKKELLRKAADYMNFKYGESACELVIEDSYRNMYEKLMPDNEALIINAREAMQEMGYTPLEDPIRGGTDGATLSFMGLPCPNLGTGGCGCHGAHEFISIQSMDTVVEILKHLVVKFA